VTLGGGVYKLGTGGGQPVGDGRLKITGSVNIAGAGSGATTIRQTDGTDRVIEVTAGSVSLSGMTVTGGALTGFAGGTPSTPGTDVIGAGILNSGTLSLDDVVVTGNRATGGAGAGSAGSGATAGGAARGGGIATSGSLTLSHSVVSGNLTTGGAGGGSGTGNGAPGGIALGAVFIAPGSTGPVRISDSEVSSNSSAGGAGGGTSSASGANGGSAAGGIAQFSQTLTVERSTVLENSASAGSGGTTSSGPAGAGADGVGGGIASEAGTLVVLASTISGNTAAGGKGGDSFNSVSGNGGAAQGGGVYAFTGATLVNTTIGANQVSPGAGGHGTNPGSTNGASGAALGGGLEDGAPSGVTLASVTLAGNSSGGRGGNVHTNGVPLAAADTIIASGSAPADSNCTPAAVTSDGGHNLDSTAQCGLDAADGDVVGADPLLAGLAANGGPTKTMALGAGSPALAAGGGCTDPSNAGAALAVDQRGQPRGAVCDIGAFQGQRPAGTGAPAVSGTPAAGQVLSCSEGQWSGDPALSFAYAWLRDGAPISGAVAAQYTVGADAGHQLACQVVASNPYGSASQVSASVLVPASGGGAADTVAPRISRFSIKPSAFRVGRSATVGFTLSEAARMSFTVERRSVGHRSGGRCRPGRGARRCVRYVKLRGSLTRAGKKGAGSFRWNGRLRGKALKPGRYRLVAVATDAAGNHSKKVRAAFRIAAKRR
jgi:hypothetical protein